MECQQSDSKKLFKVFDASKRKRTRRKQDDNNSLATDESTGVGQGRRAASVKQSQQDVMQSQNTDGEQDADMSKRDRDSSPESRSPGEGHRPSRSPRRHRRTAREGVSLALKAGMVSTPRSTSPRMDGEDASEAIPQDQDSFVYAFLEEAIKRDKKKHRHDHHHERRRSRERDPSDTKERRHHHKKHRDECRHRDKPAKEETPPADHLALFETFAKLCAQMTDKTGHYANASPVGRSQSHKSLQCEVLRKDSYDVDHKPVRLHSREPSREQSPTRARSSEYFRNRVRSHDNVSPPLDDRKENCVCCPPYNKLHPRYTSKVIVTDKNRDEDRYRAYPLESTPTRSYLDTYYRPHADGRDRRDDRDYKKCEDRRRACEAKTSRSFDVHRESHNDDERCCRRTARSDGVKDKMYDIREYRDRKHEERNYREKYYDDRVRERNYNTQGKERVRRNSERYERCSVVSKDEDYRERYSERERDSGLSVADGENSTISGKSNYLRVVKQEITEQREAMDKMMKLWKELMRCFKSISQTQGRDKDVNESAAAQLRLWRECMRRYETVARDVGDTDARLMEEINKQRSEMSEMATMWQECLQRYRDMSNDFNNLKQKLASEIPQHMSADGDPPPPPPGPAASPPGPHAPPHSHAHYRLPHDYPPMPPLPPYGGSPLRPRASAPPAWWWAEGHLPRDLSHSPDRERRHRHKDREEPRYKEKSSKPSGARSEHRHRKR
ncbi:unnamed protein product [Danaus chrysippus]|uniref:(African queen) hypothetical protein n=1 Tax=Danaus chrysippus TaxID=151541 RepID=A0A8J2QSU4_9NEOP|nr:unnamed protein product [Danaus chrysippus]